MGRSLGLVAVAYDAAGVFTISEWNSNLDFYSQIVSVHGE